VIIRVDHIRAARTEGPPARSALSSTTLTRPATYPTGPSRPGRTPSPPPSTEPTPIMRAVNCSGAEKRLRIHGVSTVTPSPAHRAPSTRPLPAHDHESGGSRRSSRPTSRAKRTPLSAPIRPRPLAALVDTPLTSTPEALPPRGEKGPLTCDFTCSGGRI